MRTSQKLHLVLLLALVMPQSGHAYMGLGPIVPLVGNGLLILAVFGMSVLGVAVYPLQTWRKWRNEKRRQSNEGGV